MVVTMRILTACLTALAATAALAQAEWNGKGELGVVVARGNADSDAANAKLEVSRELDLWKHAAALAALRTANDGVKTAERYEARWQSDRKLSERSFLFGSLRYEDDRFSGFDYQASASTGYGYRFIDTEETKFSGQVGVGYRRLEEELTGVTDSDTILRGDLNLDHALTDTARVLDKLTVEAGSDNTLVQNELSLEVRINKLFALSVGVAVRHNTDPPAGSERTDTLSTVNLVYSF